MYMCVLNHALKAQGGSMWSKNTLAEQTQKCKRIQFPLLKKSVDPDFGKTCEWIQIWIHFRSGSEFWIPPVLGVDSGAGIYDSGAGIIDSGAGIIASGAGIYDSEMIPTPES